MVDVNIVIPVMNRFDLLKECLDSIPQAVQEYSYHITIIDNASDKESADKFYAAYNKENLTVARKKENLGFPRACNKGSKARDSKYVFFLNSDVVLSPHSLDVMLARMEGDVKLGVLGMKLLFPDGSTDRNRPANRVQHVGIAMNLRAEPVHIFIGWTEDNPRVNAVKDVWAVTGAALLTRSSLFRQAKGFWEGYGQGTWEDVDYCLTVRELGYKIEVETSAVGTHFTGATAQAHNIGFPLDRNKSLFLSRHEKRIEWNEWRYL